MEDWNIPPPIPVLPYRLISRFFYAKHVVRGKVILRQNTSKFFVILQTFFVAVSFANVLDLTLNTVKCILKRIGRFPLPNIKSSNSKLNFQVKFKTIREIAFFDYNLMIKKTEFVIQTIRSKPSFNNTHINNEIKEWIIERIKNEKRAWKCESISIIRTSKQIYPSWEINFASTVAVRELLAPLGY